MSFVVVSELSHLLLVVAVLSRIFRFLIGGRRGALVGFAIGALLSLLPQQYAPPFFTRALLGELSVLSLVFLAHFLVKGLYDFQLIPRREGYYFAISGLIVALLIYPASLGVNATPDLYEAGYESMWLLAAAGALAAFFLWSRCPLATAWVGLSLLMYGWRLNESLNFWDCLVDFPAVCVCAGFLAHSIWRGARVPASLPL